MSDVVKILSDTLSNQIAAGEVVQRPASVVKELIENAVDSGATEIEVRIQDAGKTLIQVIDDGCGMSYTDARLCFEKHATSKISSEEDLFNITTLGFRGEALASIAAVSRVELKTKREEDKMGTKLKIEGSQVLSQEHIPFEKGSSISIQSLFFNTPARRNFFKSDKTEFNLINETFIRVALSYVIPAFSLVHNDKTIFKLSPKSSLKERIRGLFGKTLSENLLSVSENTEILSIEGHIGKTTTARKTRPPEYFFLNGRYIRSPYLRHAIQKAYEKFSTEKFFSPFFLHLSLSPSEFDINVHPAKTEVRFKHEKELYSILAVAIKACISKHSFLPSIDFEHLDSSFPSSSKNVILKEPTVQIDPTYNPFGVEKSTPQKTRAFQPAVSSQKIGNQEKALEKLYAIREKADQIDTFSSKIASIQEEIASARYFTLFASIDALEMESGILLIHTKKAIKRLTIQRLLTAWKKNELRVETPLIPYDFLIPEKSLSTLREYNDVLASCAFVGEVKENTYTLTSLPAAFSQLPDFDIEEIISEIILLFEAGFYDPETIKESLASKDFLFQSIKKKFSPHSTHPKELAELLIQEIKGEMILSKGIVRYIRKDHLFNLIFQE